MVPQPITATFMVFNTLLCFVKPVAEDIIPQSPGICNFIFKKARGFAVYIPWRSMLYFTQIKHFGRDRL